MKNTPGRRARPKPDIVVGPEQEVEWPGSSALATGCVLNLVSLADRIMAFGLVEVTSRGIPSVAGFNVLTILHGEGGPLAPSVIAERMILTRGTMTGIIDSLERRGLVRRSRHETDARMRLVRITDRGSELVMEILPILHRLERGWMDVLSQTDQRRLLSLLAVVQAGGPDRNREEPD
jgi:DNA-binding MarR family transcriptional regulator